MSFKNLVEIRCPICSKDTSYRVKYEASFDPESLDFAVKKINAYGFTQYSMLRM